MIKRRKYFSFLVLLIFTMVHGKVMAHFGGIIPSSNIIEQGDDREITLEIKFFHPFDGHLMDMERPMEVGLIISGKKEVLTEYLEEVRERDLKSWRLRYLVKRPGNHLFYMKPSPYLERAEGQFIIHYTKVYVEAFGLEDGWDRPAGLPIEILPLSRPYGLWTGNTFRGKVLYKGNPVSGIFVEVEYFNEGGKVKAPSSSYATQVVKTDERGVFSFSMPRSGWWGFAALKKGAEKISREGKMYPVEIGGVIWVKTVDMK